ncbi:MAG: peptide ABC transporter permease [Candidatus Omnitrophota bacterium]|nr:MAG: peptide ABC transporter permease [Candidatus Omnitrophota bacterium]
MSRRFILSGSLIIGILIILALFAPLLSPYDPNKIDVENILSPPSKAHILGTDSLGRDLLSRILYGTRVSLKVGVVAVGIALLIGVAIGALAGYCSGRIDALLMRFVDIMLCFPTFFLLLSMVAFLRPTVFNIMLIIGLTSWMGVARIVRAEVLSIKEREFIRYIKAMGAGDMRIVSKHILPNVLPSILVVGILRMGGAILTESALSFLGLGVQPPIPSWGSILMEGKSVMDIAWWMSVFPGIAILLTVLGYNLLAEGIRTLAISRS